tara:strand:+ start:630 stop:1361 length:732 start_codon:yes stop_codon:yes gene_type:complete
MGFYNGARVVDDGLIFALDAGNSKCFSNGATTATCLVSGYSVTGANGNPGSGTHTKNDANMPVYNSAKGGVFDFVGEQGMNVEGDLGGSGSGAASWCVWYNKSANGAHGANTDYFFDGRNDGGNWCLANYQSHNINWHSALEYNDGGSFTGDNTNIFNDAFHYLVVTSDSSGSKVYIDGVDVTGTADTTNSCDEEFGNNFRIGTRYTTSGQWSGYMGVIKLYNKKLSDAEVLQNYNAHKGRFI